jgi:hypothetical protein
MGRPAGELPAPDSIRNCAYQSGGMAMLRGFRNFLMRGDVIVVAVGLVVALAFSNLVQAFTDNIINPLIAAIQPGNIGPGLGWQLVKGGGDGTFLNLWRLYFGDHLLHCLHGCRLFPHRPAVQDCHGPTGQGRVW